MLRLGGPNDWRGDKRFSEHLGQCDLGAGKAAPFGNVSQPVDDLAIALFSAGIHAVSELIGLGALGAFGIPGPGQATARKRAPWNDADAFGLFSRRAIMPRRFHHVLPHDDGRLFRFNFKMMDRAIGPGELDSEKQDRARIVDPDQQRNE